MLIKNIEKCSTIDLLVDCDCDGFSSAALIYQYIKRINKNLVIRVIIHKGKVHGLSDVVNEIYKNPENYQANELEHHTSVALRELAMEEVRKEEYPFYPSRMSCLYVSRTYEEAERWGEFFARIGRPTYSIVELEVKGTYFIGDATKCFDGQTDKSINKELARLYWENPQREDNKNEVCEMLVDGEIMVLTIIKEINANI